MVQQEFAHWDCNPIMVPGALECVWFLEGQCLLPASSLCRIWDANLILVKALLGHRLSRVFASFEAVAGGLLESHLQSLSS